MSGQIFLSYGRADASAMAEQVADFLSSEGFRVWQDRPEIKPGVPFLEELEQAIRESDLVVALLSPHSVRRVSEDEDLDSVCLDELSFARFAKPPRPIVPAMAVMCEPPMVIYRQHYVDLTAKEDQTTLFERLLEGIRLALKGEVRYRSWVDSLRPWDFEPFLREKRRKFVGRHWLHAQLNAWLAGDTGEPALLVTGDPGSGKSAFAASLIERNDGRLLAYHCCQANTLETIKPARFVRSIAAMIASRLPPFEARLSGLLDTVLDEASCQADPFSAFEEGVLSPLAAVAAPTAGVGFMLIDALDEAFALGDGSGGATIVDLLADRLDRFPPWLRIVATTRNDASVLRRLRGIRHVELDVHSDANVEDVKAYVRMRATEPGLSSLLAGDSVRMENLVAKMAKAANFLFVAEALNALSRGQATLDDIESLPPGLYGLYESFFSRTFPHGGDPEALASARALLSVVLAAQAPLSEDQLARATGLDADDELPGTLKRLAPYLHLSEDEGGRDSFAVYHKSFSDWLQDPDLRGTRFYVSPKSGHTAFASLFADSYEAGVEQLTEYEIAHGPLHLAAAGEHGLLHRVLTDTSFVTTARDELGFVSLLKFYALADSALQDGPEKRSLSAIASALRLSLPSVTQEPTEFEVQLEARLRHIPALAAFCASLRDRFPPDVLVPDTYPLTRADGPLLLSLRTGFAASGVCVHQAGGVVATGGSDGSLRVWRLADGVPTLSVQMSPLSFSCAIAHSERLEAAFGTFEGSLVRLDLETGEVQRSDTRYQDVRDLFFDPGEERLFSAHESKLACWSWPSLEPLWQRAFGDEVIWAARMSGDGSAIYLATSDHLLRLDHEGRNPEVLREAPENPAAEPWDERTRHRFCALATRGDGTVAVGRDDGQIELIAPGDSVAAKMLPGHPVEWYDTSISGLEFVGDDKLISAGWDNAIRSWSVGTGQELRSVRGNSKIFAMAVFAGGTRAVTGHKMLSANVWSLETEGRVAGEQSFATSLQVSEPLALAVAQVGLRRVAIWHLNTHERREIEFEEAVSCAGIDSERGQLLVVVGKEIRAIGLETLDQGERVGSADLEFYQDAMFSPDGQRLVFDSWEGATIWRRDGATSELKLPSEERTIFTMAMANTCLALVTMRKAHFYDLTAAKPRPRTTKIRVSPHSSAISPNGKTLAVGAQDGTVIGFDTATTEELWTIDVDEGWIGALHLTDSGMLCAKGEDHLGVYDVATRERVAHLRSENRWGDGWMPEDGRSVLVGGSEGTMHVLRRVE